MWRAAFVIAWLLLAVGVAAGGNDAAPLPTELTRLDDYLRQSEARYPDLVPGTEKRILWLDGQVRRRDQAVVYLHGYSASRQESAPVGELLARRMRANLFETRLSGHGRGGDAMLEGSVAAWRQDVREAMRIGSLIGERIVLLSVSTGGTLSTWWAAAGEEPRADALVMVSPNFMPHDSRIFLLDWPLVGPFLIDYVFTDDYSWPPRNEQQARYWTWRYPYRAMVELVRLVKEVDALDKRRIHVPTLMLYSTADTVIDPRAVEESFARWGGQPKQLLVVEDSRDPSQHVLAGNILSPETTDRLVETISDFLNRLPPPAARPKKGDGGIIY